MGYWKILLFCICIEESRVYDNEGIHLVKGSGSTKIIIIYYTRIVSDYMESSLITHFEVKYCLKNLNEGTINYIYKCIDITIIINVHHWMVSSSSRSNSRRTQIWIVIMAMRWKSVENPVNIRRRNISELSIMASSTCKIFRHFIHQTDRLQEITELHSGAAMIVLRLKKLPAPSFRLLFSRFDQSANLDWMKCIRDVELERTATVRSIKSTDSLERIITIVCFFKPKK